MLIKGCRALLPGKAFGAGKKCCRHVEEEDVRWEILSFLLLCLAIYRALCRDVFLFSMPKQLASLRVQPSSRRQRVIAQAAGTYVIGFVLGMFS